MKYIDRYRDRDLTDRLAGQIRKAAAGSYTFMEVCGGHTAAIRRFGIHSLLPEGVKLISGPGCPVCVTGKGFIDLLYVYAGMNDVIIALFGDLMRIPGSGGRSLEKARAEGADIRIVFSSLDALGTARSNVGKKVIFAGIGFETTAPPNVYSVLQAQALDLQNFSILVSQVRVPPAMEAVLSSPRSRVQAFLAAGHVNAVMGYWEYLPVAEKYRVPIVVTGFEPLDLTQGILWAVRQLEQGTHEVQNAYSRVVTKEGNIKAQQAIQKVFMECDRNWRGIGMIPMSGWRLRPEFARFDAEQRFQVGDIQTHESEICIAGLILQGIKKPFDCPAFGTLCTPQTPLGATMVSSEGTCAAYYNFKRNPPVKG